MLTRCLNVSVFLSRQLVLDSSVPATHLQIFITFYGMWLTLAIWVTLFWPDVLLFLFFFLEETISGHNCPHYPSTNIDMGCDWHQLFGSHYSDQMFCFSEDSCLNRCVSSKHLVGWEVIAENIQNNRWSPAITEVSARIQENWNRKSLKNMKPNIQKNRWCPAITVVSARIQEYWNMKIGKYWNIEYWNMKMWKYENVKISKRTGGVQPLLG